MLCRSWVMMSWLMKISPWAGRWPAPVSATRSRRPTARWSTVRWGADPPPVAVAAAGSVAELAAGIVPEPSARCVRQRGLRRCPRRRPATAGDAGSSLPVLVQDEAERDHDLRSRRHDPRSADLRRDRPEGPDDLLGRNPLIDGVSDLPYIGCGRGIDGNQRRDLDQGEAPRIQSRDVPADVSRPDH